MNTEIARKPKVKKIVTILGERGFIENTEKSWKNIDKNNTYIAFFNKGHKEIQLLFNYVNVKGITISLQDIKDEKNLDGSQGLLGYWGSKHIASVDNPTMEYFEATLDHHKFY